MTLTLLAEEARQGVQVVIATPHFYANRVSIDKFIERRDAAYTRTMERLKEAGDGFQAPELVLGAEVYYFPGIGQAKDIRRAAIHEKVLLLEMPFEQWTDGMLKDVKELQAQGLTVVLAHIERYPEFQKKKDCWEMLMASRVIKQINAGSFIKAGGISGMIQGNRRVKFSMSFLQEHPETVIGTDCHNLDGRRPRLRDAREAIQGSLGEARLGEIDRLMEELL